MFRTSEVRCEVQKFTMKFTGLYTKFLINGYTLKSRQSNANITNWFVNFIMNF